MKTKNKIFSLAACLALMVGTAILGTANIGSNSVSAAEEPITFQVVQGASVRLGENGGIRFQANISKTYLNTLSGTIVLKSSVDKMGNTDENEALTKEWNVSATYNQDYATNSYYHAITFGDVSDDQLKAAAAVDMTATMWLEVNGEELEGSRQSVTRSMRSVANVAYDKGDESDKAELTKYFGERKTASVAYKELADDNAWVVDGGVVATAVYNGAALIGADLETGETATGNYALFDENYNVYNVPCVTYVTKTLAEKDDFAIFNIAEGTAEALTGYYAMVKDVSDVEANAHEGYWTSKSGKISTVNDSLGFNGTFDGVGHSLTYNCHEFGLFGNVLEEAYIKNAKFVATKVTGSFSVAMPTGALAYKSFGGKIENVYAETGLVNDKQKTNLSLIGNRQADKDSYGTMNLTNVIVKALTYYSSTTGGVLFNIDGARTMQNLDKGSNVYAISTNRYVTCNSLNTASYNGYASNDSSEGLTATYSYTNVRRYDSGEALYSTGVTQVGNWVIAADGSISWQA